MTRFDRRLTSGMELAQFAVACGIDPRFLAREVARLCKLASDFPVDTLVPFNPEAE